MKLREWLDATSTSHGLGLTASEKEARNAERQRVLAKAKTSISTLRIARCRQAKGKGRIGDDLLYRMAEATKGEKNQIFVADERPEP